MTAESKLHFDIDHYGLINVIKDFYTEAKATVLNSIAHTFLDIPITDARKIVASICLNYGTLEKERDSLCYISYPNKIVNRKELDQLIFLITQEDDHRLGLYKNLKGTIVYSVPHNGFISEAGVIHICAFTDHEYLLALFPAGYARGALKIQNGTFVNLPDRSYPLTQKQIDVLFDAELRGELSKATIEEFHKQLKGGV